MKKIMRVLLPIAAVLMMSACSSSGGGGGGSDNTIPVADAGTDQNIHTGTLVTLDGSASSDADGDALTYAWTLSSEPNSAGTALSDATAVSPTFTPSVDGTYTFSLIVNDGTDDSVADAVVITATTANAAPVADAGEDIVVYNNEIIPLNGNGTDAEDDPLTYSWSIVSAPAGSTAGLSDVTAAAPLFRPDAEGEYVFALTVNDGNSDSAADEMVLTSLSHAFITTWKTDNPSDRVGNTDTSIMISTDTSAGDFYIDWGDLSDPEHITTAGEVTHDYPAAGTYTVKISGDFPRIYFNNVGYDSEKLLTIENWGTIPWKTMKFAFYDCKNMQINALDAPNLTLVTDMSGMFSGAESFNQAIGHWDTSNVTTMNNMFNGAYTFNQPIGDWNTSNVIDMGFMFAAAKSFNQTIGEWDTSKVIAMNNMFSAAGVFNQPIDNWNTSKVKTMKWMFRNADNFNRPLNSWDTSQVTDMSGMFSSSNMHKFNESIGDWNTSNVTKMDFMFEQAWYFNQPIGNWDTSQVIDMNHMFYNARNFNQPIGNWDTSSVTDMSFMFYYAEDFNQPVGNWDTSGVTTFQAMFDMATAFDQDISDWSIVSLTDASSMLYGVTLSTANYDRLLYFWSEQLNVPSTVTFGGGNSTYTEGSQAEAGRNYLTGTKGWTITDGGPVAP